MPTAFVVRERVPSFRFEFLVQVVVSRQRQELDEVPAQRDLLEDRARLVRAAARIGLVSDRAPDRFQLFIDHAAHEVVGHLPALTEPDSVAEPVGCTYSVACRIWLICRETEISASPTGSARSCHFCGRPLSGLTRAQIADPCRPLQLIAARGAPGLTARPEWPGLQANRIFGTP